LEALHLRLRDIASDDAGESVQGEFSARARHVEAIALASEHLLSADAQLQHDQLELAAEELRLAHDALGDITGRISADDLLGKIFSSFCIGK
jgi:tRNA modification GTPase